MLARLWRAGELTPIWTPDEEQEAMRDLIRTRKQAMDARKVAKQQLLSFLLRHGLRYRNGKYWTKRHRRWLAELRRFPYPHQQLSFEELKRAIDQVETRVATLDKTIDEAVPHWHFGQFPNSLVVFHAVVGDEEVKCGLGIHAGFGLPNVVQMAFDFGLNRLRHRVQNIAGLVEPAPLLFRRTKDLAQRMPEAQGSVPNGKIRRMARPRRCKSNITSEPDFL